METDPLRIELIRIARDLQDHGIRLIVGGGYGLFLRTQQIPDTDYEKLRFKETPIARSTEDIDIFLTADIITSVEKTENVRDAILNAGFEPVTKHFQFEKEIRLGPTPVKVKIDLLAAPVPESDQIKLKLNSLPRVKPKGATGVHAYLTEEAVTIDEGLTSIDISVGATPLEVFIPHSFSYLILKLFAFRDRKDDPQKGPYHAVDLYRTVGMMTEREWEETLALAARYRDDPKVQEAATIVSNYFSGQESEGVMHIRRYLRSTGASEENVSRLIGDFKVIFLNVSQ